MLNCDNDSELTRIDWSRRRGLDNIEQELKVKPDGASPHRTVSRTITGAVVKNGEPNPLNSDGSVSMSFCAAGQGLETDETSSTSKVETTLGAERR